MSRSKPQVRTVKPPQPYVLEAQIGYLLRLANQRHIDIFNNAMPRVTPTQFAVLARLQEQGALSQNRLGRMVAMDASTTKGVVERLEAKGLLLVKPSSADRRRLVISLSASGRRFIERATSTAEAISEQTMARLDRREQKQLLALLRKMSADHQGVRPADEPAAPEQPCQRSTHA